MPIQYHEQGRYKNLPFVRVLFATNFLFAVATLVAWQTTLMFFLLPIAWSANESVPSERSFVHLFEYPLIIFWAGPAFAMFLASVFMKARHHKAAFGVLALPLLIMGLSLTMYWVLPDGTR